MDWDGAEERAALRRRVMKSSRGVSGRGLAWGGPEVEYRYVVRRVLKPSRVVR